MTVVDHQSLSNFSKNFDLRNVVFLLHLKILLTDNVILMAAFHFSISLNYYFEFPTTNKANQINLIHFGAYAGYVAA